MTRGLFVTLEGGEGAGKSTLMRIISGIFNQSYGKIWINGIDTQEQREELQGLIGYLPQNVELIGQVDRKFLATLARKVEDADTKPRKLLVLFDQHAMHERHRILTGLTPATELFPEKKEK